MRSVEVAKMGKQIEDYRPLSDGDRRKAVEQVWQLAGKGVEGSGNGAGQPLFGIEVEYHLISELRAAPGMYIPVALLRGDLQTLRELSGNGRLGKLAEFHGLEEGELRKRISRLIGPGDGSYTYELGPSQGEVAVQQPATLSAGGVESLLSEYLERTSRLRETVKAVYGERADLLSASLPPVAELGELLGVENMTPRHRYRMLVRELGGGDYRVSLPLEGGSELRLDNVTSVGVENGLHITVSFPRAEETLEFYNNILSMVPLVSAVDANSSYLAERKLAFEKAKPLVLEGSVNVTGRPPRGGQYWRKLESWQELLDYKLEHIEGSFRPLFYEDSPGSTFAVWWGTIWDWVRPRVRAGGRLEVYAVEVRTPDQQPTLKDSVAVALFTIGLGLNPHGELDIDDPEKMEENFYRSLAYGRDAWLHTAGGTERASALLPEAYRRAVEGLEKYVHGVDRYLAPVKERIEGGYSPSREFRALIGLRGVEGATRELSERLYRELS